MWKKVWKIFAESLQGFSESFFSLFANQKERKKERKHFGRLNSQRPFLTCVRKCISSYSIWYKMQQFPFGSIEKNLTLYIKGRFLWKIWFYPIYFVWYLGDYGDKNEHHSQFSDNFLATRYQTCILRTAFFDLELVLTDWCKFWLACTSYLIQLGWLVWHKSSQTHCKSEKKRKKNLGLNIGFRFFPFFLRNSMQTKMYIIHVCS